MTPEHRMMKLELQHAAAAIGRASLLSKGSEFEADLKRLLDYARDTLALIDAQAMGLSKEDIA